MFIGYLIAVVVVAICLNSIHKIFRASKIRANLNTAPDLRKESVLLKTQDVEFKLKYFPTVGPGQNAIYMAYYIEKQQVIVTEKGIILSAIVRGKEQADRYYYFTTTGIDPEAIKLGVVNVFDVLKEKGSQLFLKTVESNSFLPIFEVIRFDKSSKELVSILKEKVKQGDFGEE